MSAGKSNSDQRKSFRCAVVDGRQRCELTLGDDIVPAKLVDESAGGFAVLVHRPAAPTSDQPAQIRTAGGCYHVRLVHIQEVLNDDEENEEKEEATEPGAWYRLGLRRLNEVVTPERPGFWRRLQSLFPASRQWRVPDGFPLVSGLLLIAVGVGVTIVLMNSPWALWKQEDFRMPDSPEPVAPFSKGFQPPSESGWSPKLPFFSDGAGKPESSRGTSPSGINALLHLPGAAPLALPEVVQRLQLTEDQQQRIRQLIESTEQAVREVNGRSMNGKRHRVLEERTRLLDQARREAIQLLTDEQRAEWQKMVAAASSSAEEPAAARNGP